MTLKYTPEYRWYDTLEGMEIDSPMFVSSEDSFFNRQVSGLFKFNKHGGCLGGSIQCLYEFTTHLAVGWWVGVKLNPDSDFVYNGVITSIKHTYTGMSTIETYGLIQRINGFLSSELKFNFDEPQDIISKIVSEHMKAEDSEDVINNIVTMEPSRFGDGDPEFMSHVAVSLSSVRREILSVATFSGSCMYGFLPHNTLIGVEQMPVICTDFVSLNGNPLEGRIIKVSEGFLANYMNSTDQIVNSVRLYGDTPEHSWAADDLVSINMYGLRRVFYKKRGLTDSVFGEELANNILISSNYPIDRWEYAIPHTDTDDQWNMVENGVPFPWKEVLTLTDEYGSDILSMFPTGELTINMGMSLSVSLATGNFSRDARLMFGIDEVSTTPYYPYVANDKKVNRSTKLVRPDGLGEPPVGIMLPQKYYGGVSEPAFTQNRATYTNVDYIGSGTLTQRTTESMTFYVTWDKVIQYFGECDLPTPEFVDASDGNAIKTLVNYFDNLGVQQTRNVISNFSNPIQASIYLGPDIPGTGARDHYQGLTVDGNIMPKFLVGELLGALSQEVSTRTIEALSGLIDQGKYTRRIYSVDVYPIVSPYTFDPNNQSGPKGIYATLPWRLIFHFGGDTVNGIPGRSGATNYEYLMATYGGGTNIYSMLVQRYPYSVTYSGTPSGYLTADYASRAVYFTEAGAAAALAAGYYWEEMIIPYTSSQNVGNYGERSLEDTGIDTAIVSVPFRGMEHILYSYDYLSSYISERSPMFGQGNKYEVINPLMSTYANLIEQSSGFLKATDAYVNYAATLYEAMIREESKNVNQGTVDANIYWAFSYRGALKFRRWVTSIGGWDKIAEMYKAITRSQEYRDRIDDANYAAWAAANPDLAKERWAKIGRRYPQHYDPNRETELVRTHNHYGTPGFKLIRKKRMITGLTRISYTAHRDPVEGETSISKTYGLPEWRKWEYRVRGYDDDHATTYVNA